MTLPQKAKVDGVTAVDKDGVLEVRVPCEEVALRATRQIPIPRLDA